MVKQPILVEYKKKPNEYRHIPAEDIRAHHEHEIRRIEQKERTVNGL